MALTPELLELQQALLGRYSLERELGRGGMGTVYLARDVRLDRPVAIKVLHPHLAKDDQARDRFLHEARTAAGLSHPHIVPIFAVETREPFVLLVMEFVQGETLGTRIRGRGRLRADDAERVLREIAWALGYAHAHGVVHRDITLENILLEHGSGRALLVDFGLAGQFDNETAAPRFGTPGYLAPEVIRGEPATPASDLYALGVVGWTALVGKAPYAAETAGQLLAKHLVQPVPTMGSQARGASRRLVAAIESCLAKIADERPQGTTAFLGLLERAPEPVAIAPALRSWFTRWERIAPFYSIITPVLALQTWLLAMSYYRTGDAPLFMAAMVSGAFSLTLFPMAAHLIFETREMRQLRGEGFGIDDIRTAAPLWEEELKHEREREGLRPLASRVIFDLTVVAVITVILVSFVLEPELLKHGGTKSPLVIWLLSLSGATPTIYLFGMLGIGIGFVSPGYRMPVNGFVRDRIAAFWETRIAARFAALAGVAQRKRQQATATLHRPTAMVLGLAIDDLWKAMPRALQADLGDVPALAHTLQASATELRTLIVQLEETERSISSDTDHTPDVRATREALEVRHREVVAMLEKLRLQLLRLLSSRQHTSELTQQLDAARLLEAALLRDIEGHQGVRRMLGKPRKRARDNSASPSPTPVAA